MHDKVIDRLASKLDFAEVKLLKKMVNLRINKCGLSYKRIKGGSFHVL